MSKMSKLITAIKAFNVSECVKDFDGIIMPQFCITEDLSVWDGLGVTNVDELEEILDLRHGFSDFHKEVHGTRPRWKTDHYTLSDWRKTYENLAEDSKQNAIHEAEHEAEHEALCVNAFKKLIAKTAAMGAKDFKTAMRWLMDADDCNPRYPQAVESFFYGHGILFTEYGQKLSKLKY